MLELQNSKQIHFEPLQVPQYLGDVSSSSDARLHIADLGRASRADGFGEHGCNSKQTFSASGVEVHSLGVRRCNAKQTSSVLGGEAVPRRQLSKALLGKADRGEKTGRPAQEGCPKPSTGRPAQEGCPKASGMQYSDGTAVPARDNIAQYVEAHGDELERVNVKGSLARHADFWKTLTSDQLILGIIENGYQPPFLSTPPKFRKKNNATAIKNSQFVTHSVLELIINGFANLTKKPCKVTNPFTVSTQSNGKKRLIADLRHLNFFLQTEKFKMEDLRIALPALRQSEYMFSFDITKAYYHIDLHPSAWEYFGFAFECGGKTYFGHYTTLPFGLSTAPWIQTKIMRPLVARWHAAGLHIFVFIDDGLGACKEEDEAVEFSDLVQTDLKRAGIIEQPKKSVWKPRKVITWLGFEIDLARKLLIIPEQKRMLALTRVQMCVQKQLVSARELARAAGLINSLALVLGKNALIHTKLFFAEVKEYVHHRYQWDRKFKLKPNTKQCLRYWLQKLAVENLQAKLGQAEPNLVIYSDASATGGSAYIDQDMFTGAQVREGDVIRPQNMCLVNWTEAEAAKSSTWREVKTIEVGLCALQDKLRGRSISWQTDNLPGVSVIRKGSMKTDLNPLAAKIQDVCQKNDIDLSVNWVRRTENVTADRLSRFIDLDDWGISNEFFEEIQEKWGKCTCDTFATAANAKLKKFYSKFASEGTAGIDAFNQQWNADVQWCVPPPFLIPQVLSHFKKCKARGILVVPHWPSSRYWPFLFTRAGPESFIKAQELVPNGARILIAGTQPKSIFTPAKFKNAMLALFIDTA